MVAVLSELIRNNSPARIKETVTSVEESQQADLLPEKIHRPAQFWFMEGQELQQ